MALFVIFAEGPLLYISFIVYLEVSHLGMLKDLNTNTSDNWQFSDPDFPFDNLCMVLLQNGSWRSRLCNDTTESYICQFGKFLILQYK